MGLGDRSQPAVPGCSVYIPPDVRHALRCTGEEPLVFVFAVPRDRFDEIAYHFDR
ncbi:MAG: cupin domain-containing protein [Paracoccaceae bacterium]|nr:cupin domain-containing protein [Paracoccaceae bacterium]